MNSLANLLPEFMRFDALETASVVLLLGVIMFLGTAGGALFKKWKIPQVVGYIVVGIVIGQSGVQLLGENVVAALDPLSSFALSLIGFLIGAELKTSVIKKYGKQFVGILLFESIIPFVSVSIAVSLAAYAVMREWNTAVSLGLVLGAISSATAPAATTDVLRENRTRGPLTTTVLGIVALDDAVALILYAASASVASALLGAEGESFGAQLLRVAYSVCGSIVAGGIIGFLLTALIRAVASDEGRILSFSLSILLLSTGLCGLLGLDNILTAMSVGFFMVNFSSAKIKATFSLVEKFTPPIYVLFFVLVGAKLNIWKITSFVALIAFLYVFFRTAGKSIGSIIGSVITKAPVAVKKYLPFCLLSQAGVAIGLSIAAGRQFSQSIGPMIMLIITATTFVVQLLGPICVKYGVQKAGECGLNITEEDVLAQGVVNDVFRAIYDGQPKTIVDENTNLRRMLELFGRQRNLNYAVCNSSGVLTGIITLEHLKETLTVADISDCLAAVDIMDAPSAVCALDTSLPEVNQLFLRLGIGVIPIVDKNNHALGVIEKDALDRYVHTKVVELHSKANDLAS